MLHTARGAPVIHVLDEKLPWAHSKLNSEHNVRRNASSYSSSAFAGPCLVLSGIGNCSIPTFDNIKHVLTNSMWMQKHLNDVSGSKQNNSLREQSPGSRADSWTHTKLDNVLSVFPVLYETMPSEQKQGKPTLTAVEWLHKPQTSPNFEACRSRPTHSIYSSMTIGGMQPAVCSARNVVCCNSAAAFSHFTPGCAIRVWNNITQTHMPHSIDVCANQRKITDSGPITHDWDFLTITNAHRSSAKSQACTAHTFPSRQGSCNIRMPTRGKPGNASSAYMYIAQWSSVLRTRLCWAGAAALNATTKKPQ